MQSKETDAQRVEGVAESPPKDPTLYRSCHRSETSEARGALHDSNIGDGNNDDSYTSFAESVLQSIQDSNRSLNNKINNEIKQQSSRRQPHGCVTSTSSSSEAATKADDNDNDKIEGKTSSPTGTVQQTQEPEQTTPAATATVTTTTTTIDNRKDRKRPPPQLLYDRDEQRQALLNAWERIHTKIADADANATIHNRRELLLITGASGSGKTCFVKTYFRPLFDANHDYWMTIKFDFQRTRTETTTLSNTTHNGQHDDSSGHALSSSMIEAGNGRSGYALSSSMIEPSSGRGFSSMNESSIIGNHNNNGGGRNERNSTNNHREPYQALRSAMVQFLRQIDQVFADSLSQTITKHVEASEYPHLLSMIPALKRLSVVNENTDTTEPTSRSSSKYSAINQDQDPSSSFKAVSHSRLRVIFRKLMKAISATLDRFERKLVIFLDDLQFADYTSLDILFPCLFQYSMNDRTATSAGTRNNQPLSSRIILVGTCRDDEVEFEHPLSVQLRKWEDYNTLQVEVIRLENLSISAIQQLILDKFGTLQKPEAAVDSCAPANDEGYEGTSSHLNSLATLVHEQTGGNAFFVHQLLQGFVEEGIIRSHTSEKASGEINQDTPCWTWQTPRHHSTLASATSVHGLLTTRIKSMLPSTQIILQFASSLGTNEFRLDYIRILTVASSMSDSEFEDALVEAEYSGFITRDVDNQLEEISSNMPQSTNPPTYSGTWTRQTARFVHDQFQEASYRLVLETYAEQCLDYHCEIARTLWSAWKEVSQRHENLQEQERIQNRANRYGANSRQDQDDTRQPIHSTDMLDSIKAIEDMAGILLVTCNQFMMGSTALREDEQAPVAALCYNCAKVAALSSAFGSAAAYVEFGVALLDYRWNNDQRRTQWRNHYRLTLDLHNLAIELENCNGNHSAVDAIFEQVDVHARSFDDRLDAHVAYIYSLGSRGDSARAVREGFEVLKRLGEPFPKRFTLLHTIKDLIKTQKLLKNKTDEDILNLPVATDRRVLSAMKVLKVLHHHILFGVQEYSPLVAMRSIHMTLRHGLSPMSAVGFGIYAITLWHATGDIELVYRYGRLAQNIYEKYPSTDFLARTVGATYGLIFPHKDPLKDSLEPLLEGFRMGLMAGDLEVSFMCSALYGGGCVYSSAVPLGEAVEKMLNFQQLCFDYDLPAANASIAVFLQMGLNLQGEYNESPLILTGSAWNEKEMLRISKETKNSAFAAWIFVAKIFLAVYMNDMNEALIVRRNNRKTSMLALAPFSLKAHRFHEGLICATQATRSRRKRKLAAQLLKQIQEWAVHSPANYEHKGYLIEAELQRSEGNLETATELYRRAIRSASSNGYINECALAEERFAYALNERNDPDAIIHLTRARELYMEWGAHLKVSHLNEVMATQFRR